MTDNEKRAHDIAVALLPQRFQLALDRCAEKGSGGIDLAELYFETYEKALKEVKDHFGEA